MNTTTLQIAVLTLAISAFACAGVSPEGDSSGSSQTGTSFPASSSGTSDSPFLSPAIPSVPGLTMLAFSQQMLLPENDSSVPYRVYFLPDIACDFPSLAPQSQATLPVGVIAAAPADQTVTAQCGKHSISSTSLGQVLNGGILNAVYNDESKTLQISPDEEFLNMAFIWTSMTSQADNLCFNVSPSHENGVFSLDATDFEAAEATIPSDHCQALGNASSCTLSTDNIYVSVLAAGTFFNFSATADSQSVQTFRTKLLNAQIGPPPNPDETTSGTSTGSTSPGTKMP